MDVFDLKVEAVNTHRDRPLVRYSICTVLLLFLFLFSVFVVLLLQLHKN